MGIYTLLAWKIKAMGMYTPTRESPSAKLKSWIFKTGDTRPNQMRRESWFNPNDRTEARSAAVNKKWIDESLQKQWNKEPFKASLCNPTTFGAMGCWCFGTDHTPRSFWPAESKGTEHKTEGWFFMSKEFLWSALQKKKLSQGKIGEMGRKSCAKPQSRQGKRQRTLALVTEMRT